MAKSEVTLHQDHPVRGERTVSRVYEGTRSEVTHQAHHDAKTYSTNLGKWDVTVGRETESGTPRHRSGNPKKSG